MQPLQGNFLHVFMGENDVKWRTQFSYAFVEISCKIDLYNQIPKGPSEMSSKLDISELLRKSFLALLHLHYRVVFTSLEKNRLN